MPLFSPVLNDAFFDKKTIAKCFATKKQLLVARLFGIPFSYKTEDGTIKGHRHNGVVYITDYINP